MNKSLYKFSLFSFLIDPLFYVCALITILYTSFNFFFVNHFFVTAQATSDLRVFFYGISQISILTVPLLVFRLRRFITDDSLPLSPASRFISLGAAVLSALLIPVFLLIAVPVLVSFYGNVDAGQVAAGFTGTLFYFLCSVFFVLMLFAVLRKENGALPLFLAVVCLFCFNFCHLIPLYLRTGDIFSSLLQKVSFAWRFDSFSKGIIDTRNILFYVLSSVLFLFIAVLYEHKRTGRKTDKVNAILLTLSLIFCFKAFSSLYSRFDMSFSRQYSISKTTEKLCKQLENPLRITYWQSKELKQYYPQTQDVTEFLKSFAQTSPSISLSIEKADPERLSRLGIQGQQLKTENTTKLEYTMVYSAILLQYLDKSTIIPFVLSPQTLEYDLAQRIQQLLTEQDRTVFIVCGNGLNIEEDYSYVVPWLASRGFNPVQLPFEKTSSLDLLSPQTIASSQLLVLGSSQLSYEQSQSIKNVVEKGMSSLFLTSPYTAAIKNDWNVTKNINDSLIPVLNSWGFAFDYSLACDLSNYALTMQTGEGNQTQYQTINYPLWISVLPQGIAYEGVIVSWASPINLYGNTKPLLLSSPQAWIQKPAASEKEPFLVNPFLIPKTAQASDAQNQQLVLGAFLSDEKIKAALISDQYFVSSLMTGFTSGEDQGDFRNYDFITSVLLELRGESELNGIMMTGRPNRSLYKITDSLKLQEMRKICIIVTMAVLPSVILIIWITVIILRKKFKEEKHETE